MDRPEIENTLAMADPGYAVVQADELDTVDSIVATLPRIEPGMRIRVEYLHPVARAIPHQTHAGRTGIVNRRDPVANAKGQSHLWYVILDAVNGGEAIEVVLHPACLVPFLSPAAPPCLAHGVLAQPKRESRP